MNLCKNCKNINSTDLTCKKVFNCVVNGSRVSDRNCKYMRESELYCGGEGKYFKKKEIHIHETKLIRRFGSFDSSIMWEPDPPENPMIWEEAEKYCYVLSKDGYGDWRLPTVQELLSIVNFDKIDPACVMEGMKSGRYWSASMFSGNPNHVWSVHFAYGYMLSHDMYSDNYTRAVRDVE